MNEPRTELDPRFSDPDTEPTSWRDTVAVIESAQLAWITDRPTLEQLGAAWATKWDGRWRYRVDADGFRHEDGDHGPVHVYEVRPVKTLAFGKHPFTHTRHTPKDRA